MTKRWSLLLSLLWLLSALLAGCQAKDAATPSPAPGAAATTPAAATPALPQARPTPTSLAEGWFSGGAAPRPAPDCPDPYPWFFENRAAECPTVVLNTWAVMQAFEHGLMVWFQEDGQTYVLLDDGSLFRPYHEVRDPAGLALPGPDPAITPPEGLSQPELGFAKFWRGLAPGSEWVRERLGWARAPEQGYSALWQCNTATDSAARCYFSGPGDEIIGITRGGEAYWNYWQGPVR